MNSQRHKSTKRRTTKKQKDRRADFIRPIENLPDSLDEDFKQLKLEPPPRQDTLFRWINDLLSQNSAVSDFALQNLAKHNGLENLPLLLWFSPCTVTKLLQEVIKAFGHKALPFPPQLNIDRLYNVLLVFQCIARHPLTRPKFLKADMPHFFYPLMDIGLVDNTHECVRFGALSVIDHLLEAPIDGAAIRFLMDTDAFRYCIKPIEFGSIESKTVAVRILYKIMSNDEGLPYFCELANRVFIIDGLLKELLFYLSSMTKPCPILLNLVFLCYVKLSQNSRACEELRRNIPVLLFDGTFTSLFAGNPIAKSYLMKLREKLEYKKSKAMK